MSLSKAVYASDLELSDRTFKLFSGLMYDLAGVDLPVTPKNKSLVKNRLTKIVRKYELEDYETYWEMLQKKDKAHISEFISALTTNMTSFFRESAHFDWLLNHLTNDFKKPELRIWCAAASIGAEPYTLAITAAEAIPENQHSKIKILATDIDLVVLKKAAQGFYTPNEASGLQPEQLKKYFHNGVQKGHSGYQVKDSLKKMITFAPFNLMSDNYPTRKPMDIIFCRNVLIYFDEKTTKKVIDQLISCLSPGGFLILGHSESGNVKHEKVKAQSKATYRKII